MEGRKTELPTDPEPKDISQSGLNFLKHYEGLGDNTKNGLYFAYDDDAGYLTIGYGHVIREEESDIYLGGMDLETALDLLHDDPDEFMNVTVGLTEPECNSLLKEDMRRYVARVNKLLSVATSDNEFDALVSLCYNVGPWDKDGILGTPLKEANMLQAALAMPHFNKSTVEETGEFGPWKGLTFRRYSEMWLFLTGAHVFAQTWPLCNEFLRTIKDYYKDHDYPEEMPYEDCLEENMIN